MVKDGIFLGKRYEVLSKVGAGGMADVYKGRDTMLNRYVAIKVLKREFREEDEFIRKFRSEAQSAASLLNPNIVNVYDVGEDRGLYYMVMELVEGISLKEYIERKGRLSHKEVISIAIQMCTGIGAAHAAGIIHRDIKPQNIIISRDGKVKVTDFGIAKAVTSNTISSNAMGSVHYTSPEQARGGYSDAKSDIYSIGITLFEMVTGQVPFDGDSTVSIAIKHLQEEVTPPSEFVPDVPYSLEQIILKCTQKNAERRYASTSALIQDLKRSLVDPDGDFVYIPPLRNADTVIITDEELDDIRHSYDDEYDDDEDYDHYHNDSRLYHDDEYQDDGDDEEDYEDDYGRGTGGQRMDSRDSDTVNPRMNKVMKILMIVVAVIIAFVLIYGIGKAAGIFKSAGSGTTAEKNTDEVKVPDVVGKSEEEAKEILNKKKLGYKPVAREESKKYDEGIVCEQKQKAGSKVKKNTTIQVVVSTGLVGEELLVPNIVGWSEEDAQKTLNDSGFENVSSEYEYDSEVPEGNVISMTPQAGSKATKDTDIKMIVSKGTEKVKVPNVVGKTQSDAQDQIVSAGLDYNNTNTEYSDTVKKGKVISQSPEAGKRVGPDTVVTIVISDGPKPEENVEIENFIGSYEEALTDWAYENDLNAVKSKEEYSNTYPAGTIISQSPSSGKVKKGTRIKYVLSKGPEPVQEPDPGQEPEPDTQEPDPDGGDSGDDAY